LKEALLEPLLRRMRLARVQSWLPNGKSPELLDIGCGWEARLLRELEPYIGKGVGIDFKAPPLTTRKLSTISCRLSDQLPFDADSFDVVTMLAVLEHLDRPREIVAEIARVLRPRGRLLLTVPSPAAKPVLEFLAYRMGIISRAEIEDHKTYFDREALIGMFSDAQAWKILHHTYFQLRFNNFFVVEKVGRQRKE
jgi:2-polyprenyl-3-methyl-5-hydroxy-6-metoxy-1,4-benzoquinol methylase